MNFKFSLLLIQIVFCSKLFSNDQGQLIFLPLIEQSNIETEKQFEDQVTNQEGPLMGLGGEKMGLGGEKIKNNEQKQYGLAIDKQNNYKSYSANKVMGVMISDVSDFLKSTRKNICKAIKPGSITISIAVSKEGILSYISSINGGFSVTIECK